MRIREYVLALLVCGVCGAYAGYAPGIIPDGNLDALLFRLAVRHRVHLSARYYLRPLNYADLESFLSSASNGNDSLYTREEQHRIKGVLSRYGLPDALYRFTVPKSDLTLKVNCNLLGDVRPGIGDSILLRASGIINPSISGSIGPISFYSGVQVWTEYRRDTLFTFPSYEPYDGVAYNLYGRDTESAHIRSSDLPYGGVSFDTRRIRIEAGIDRLRSGPARFFPLTLSGTAPPMTYMRAACDLEVVNYSHIVSLLKSQKDKRKYLFMHRLEGDLWKNRIHVGINEVVVYGSTTDEPLLYPDSINPLYVQAVRSVEPEYMIPFIPFKFIEHYNGDRDNAAISADFSLFWPASWNFYGEFFLDDMLSPLKILTEDWGNKWAFTLGVGYEGVLHGKPLSALVECSRVEPWVYTHFGGGSHRYSHFGRSLGSPLGPNTLAVRALSLVQVSNMHQLGGGINLQASNSTTRGGTITDVFQHPDSENPDAYYDSSVKEFLGEGALWYLEPVIYWNFNVFGQFSINSSLAVDLLEHAGRLQASFFGGLYF